MNSNSILISLTNTFNVVSMYISPDFVIFRSARTSSIDYVSDANADYVSDVNADYVSDVNASVSAPPPSPFNLPQSPSPLAYSPYTKVQMLFKQT